MRAHATYVLAGALACWLLVNAFLPSYLNALSLDPGIALGELFDNPRAAQLIADRYDEPAFVVRYGVSDLQEALAGLGVPEATTFTLVNLLGLGVTGLLLARLMPARRDGPTRRLALAALLLWLPVLTALTAYTSAYDDFVQWPLLLLAWVACRTAANRPWRVLLAVLAMTAAVLVRETSAVFAGYLLLVSLRRRRWRLAAGLALAVAAGLYVLGRHPAAAENAAFAAGRLTMALRSNFGSLRDGAEAVLLVATVVALPAYLLARANREAGRGVGPEAWLLLLGNTALVTTCAIIHETRLFVLGMLPLLITLGHPGVQRALVAYVRAVPRRAWAILALASAAVAFVGYRPSAGRSAVVYQLYMWPYLTLLVGAAWGAARGSGRAFAKTGHGATRGHRRDYAKARVRLENPLPTPERGPCPIPS